MKNWWQNLPERIRTVILWAPIPIFMIILSKWTSWIIFTLLAATAVYEWRRIILKSKENLENINMKISVLGVVATMVVALFNVYLALIMALGLSAFLSWRSENTNKMDILLAQMVPSLVGVGAFFVRSEPNGLALLGLLLIITSFSDSAAYFVGKAIGKHKFAPKISPNKTWEGAIGGWVFAIVAALVYCQFFVPTIAAWPFFFKLILFWTLSFASQLGDLGESAIKRKYDVKDAGGIFPGHGGVMDRFDSFAGVIFVLGFVSLFVNL